MSVGRKYELIPESGGLFRLRALRNFGEVRKGDLGGLVQSEENLSHEGNCWVHENAKAIEESRVSDHAVLFDHSLAKGQAQVSGLGRLYGHSVVEGLAVVEDLAQVYDWCLVTGGSRVSDDAYLGGAVTLEGMVMVQEAAILIGRMTFETKERNYIILTNITITN